MSIKKRMESEQEYYENNENRTCRSTLTIDTGKIGYNKRTKHLYALEQELEEKFQEVCREIAKVLDHNIKDFWTRTVPTALYSFLDEWDTKAVDEACEAILMLHKLEREREQR